MERIEKCNELVRVVYADMDASHDYLHIERVYQNAEAILNTEPTANALLVRLAVLLHDVSDSKYAADKSNEERILQILNLSEEEQNQIRAIIAEVSFNGGNELEATSIEAKIVRDADRLDAIGAVAVSYTHLRAHET